MSLQLYIDAWKQASDAILALNLDESQGALETSLPGWAVRDILAHLVHLEEAIAHGENEEATIGLSRAGISSEYTNRGVEALSEVPVAELNERLRTVIEKRLAQLTPVPTDPSAPADRSLAGAEWPWETLLRNRAIDAWLHEQDIRRVIGEPGGQGSLGAHVTVNTLGAALPFVVGKLAQVPAGHAVRFEVAGEVPFDRTVAVGEDGRAGFTDAEAATTISMNSEAFTRLLGGREPLESFDVVVSGDEQIAARVLANMAVTP